MIVTRLAAVATSILLASGLAACGGPTAKSIASESCDLVKSVDIEKLMKDAVDQAMSGDATVPPQLAELEKKGKALEKKAKDAGISESDVEKAMKDECGDELKKFEDLGSAEG